MISWIVNLFEFFFLFDTKLPFSAPHPPFSTIHSESILRLAKERAKFKISSRRIIHANGEEIRLNEFLEHTTHESGMWEK